MKKLQLAILILVVIALFVSADYFVNLPGGIPRPSPSMPSSTQGQLDETPVVVDYPNITKQILEQGTFTQDFKIEKRSRSTELFENFDLTNVANIGIFRNILISGVDGQAPLYIYEIHAPTGQGAIAYLNIKLAIIDQLKTGAGINETGNLGYSSLFYNDPAREGIGFLVSQIGDMTFGFQYDKNSASAFDFSKTLINTYMSSVTK